MTLQDLGNIGEFLGSIGVIVTLIYLAIQIRQNTKAARASSAAESQYVFANTNEWLLENPEVHLLINRTSADGAPVLSTASTPEVNIWISDGCFGQPLNN